MVKNNFNNKSYFPYTYGDNLEEGNGFTSEAIVRKTKEYWSDEENQMNFNQGYRLGLLVFGFASLFLTSKAAFASDSKGVPDGNSGGQNSCPAPSPGKPKPPTSDRGTFGASVLGICSVAMSTGAYWVGFICAASFIIGVRMSIIANQ